MKKEGFLVNQDDNILCVVEPILAVPVGESEFQGEVDSMSGVEVEGVGVIFEEVESFGVVMMIVVKDVVNINCNRCSSNSRCQWQHCCRRHWYLWLKT